jgi:acyl carrier protein
MNSTFNTHAWELMRAIVAEEAGCTLEEVTGNARLTEDLGFDSLAMAGLLITLESHGAPALSPTEVKRLRTVQDLYEHLGALS